MGVWCIGGVPLSLGCSGGEGRAGRGCVNKHLSGTGITLTPVRESINIIFLYLYTVIINITLITRSF